jgi:hypothetical protein
MAILCYFCRKDLEQAAPFGPLPELDLTPVNLERHFAYVIASALAVISAPR